MTAYNNNLACVKCKYVYTINQTTNQRLLSNTMVFTEIKG